MNKVPALIDTIPKSFKHNSMLQIQRKKNFLYVAKKKIFTDKTNIKEEESRVVIDSYVEWYDIKNKKMRRKRFLQVYDCEDQECEML